MTFGVYPCAYGRIFLGTYMSSWTFEGDTTQMLGWIKNRASRGQIIHEVKEGVHGWQNPIETIDD